jgi:hypothetical protein
MVGVPLIDDRIRALELVEVGEPRPMSRIRARAPRVAAEVTH